MRNYKYKNNLLPHNVYMQVLYKVRDYTRLELEYHELLYASNQPSDGQPKGNQTGNPTERKAERLIVVSHEMEAIEQALTQIPEEYRNGVFDNVCYGIPYNLQYVHYNTWGIHRRSFLENVAKKLNLI
jgi:hypothetical protein